MPSACKQLIIFLSIIGSVILPAKSVKVELADGIIDGTVFTTRYAEEFHAFLKIPYAAPPLGDLRFSAPSAQPPWSGVLNATEYSPMCMQLNLLSDSPVSEDCLYLNVFTKNLPSETNGGLKPVIAYVHGGAFQLGSASDHSPHLLMERDVVLVTINYRIGAFGFLSLGTEEIPGNAGLKDQAMALNWIKLNIEKFGGDPNLVTLMGNSAGAYSVTAHLVSPLTKGLFHRTIAFSGSIAYQRKLKTEYLDLGMQLAEKLNCTMDSIEAMVDCLRTVPAHYFNLVELREYPQCTIMTWFPVIEKDFGQDRFLVDDPVELFRNGSFSKVPLIIGRTKDEFLDIPYRMINNEISQKLNENFEEVAPHCFFFEEGTEKSKTMSRKFKEFYLRNEEITNKSLTSLSSLFNDGYIGYGVHKLVHLLSSITEVFYYQLTYVGRYSFFYHRDKPFGAHHGDEMQYILTTVFIGPRIEVDEPENFLVERMTRLIEQFAVTGDPNNSTDAILKEIVWPKHDEEYEFYLDIGNHLTERQELGLERYSVWDELDRSTGLKLSPENFSILLIALNAINQIFLITNAFLSN